MPIGGTLVDGESLIQEKMPIGGGCRILMSAAKEAAARTRVAPAVSSRSKSKAKASAAKGVEPPLASSQLGKYLGIPMPKRSEKTMLLSKFIKLHTQKNPGIKKDGLCEEKLKNVLEGKDRIGISEVIKLLSQQPGRAR